MKRLLIGAAVAMTIAGAAADVQAQPRHHRGGGGWDHGGGGWNHGGWDRGRRGGWDRGNRYYRGDYGRRGYRYGYGYAYPSYPYAFYLNIGPSYRYRRHHRRHWECWENRWGREVCGWVRW